MNSHAPGPEAWQRTSDVVLRGLNHTLSNRLTVLASLVSDVATSTPEGEALGEQVEGLFQLLRLYRAVPVSTATSVEALRVQDVVADAVLLFAASLETRDVTCEVREEGAAPPVLFDRVALVQALLLLMSAAARFLNPLIPAQALVLRLHGDADWVHVSAETREPATNPAVSVAPGDADDLEALRWMVRAAHGSVEVEREPEGVGRVHLRLSSLTRLRRLES